MPHGVCPVKAPAHHRQHPTDEAKFLNRPVPSWPVEYEDEVVTRGITPVGRPCLRDVERSERRPRLSEDRLVDPRDILVLPRD